MLNTPLPAKNIEDEVRQLKDRVIELEARTESIARAFSRLRHQGRRPSIRPPLWTFEQYGAKKLDIGLAYQNERMPVDAISIAIATPSFNHAKYLSATIDSILMQNYPHLSYLVQDGGSSDSTVEICSHTVRGWHGAAHRTVARLRPSIVRSPPARAT